MWAADAQTHDQTETETGTAGRGILNLDTAEGGTSTARCQMEMDMAVGEHVGEERENKCRLY